MIDVMLAACVNGQQCVCAHVHARAGVHARTRVSVQVHTWNDPLARVHDSRAHIDEALARRCAGAANTT